MGTRTMFPFRHIVRANDVTINGYIEQANWLGIEGASWTYEWMDGGRAVFAFDTEERRNNFKFFVDYFVHWRMTKRQT